MSWEDEKERLWIDTGGRPCLHPEQSLRLEAVKVAVQHHRGDELFPGNPGYRNRVETVLQTADYFFDYVRSGKHVSPHTTPNPNQSELFVAQ